MSTANDSHSTGRAAMNRSPNAMSASPARGLARGCPPGPAAGSGSIGGSRSVAHSTAVNSTASTAYATATPYRPPCASTRPAHSGPATIATVLIV